MDISPHATLGQMVETYFALVAEKKQFEASASDCGKAIDELEQAVIAACDAQGLTGAPSKLGAVKIIESIIPHVTDWDAYWEFIYANRYGHLVTRRPSLTGCRELFEQGIRIPGVQPFVKRTLKRSAA
jgi:hypothetical protein